MMGQTQSIYRKLIYFSINFIKCMFPLRYRKHFFLFNSDLTYRIFGPDSIHYDKFGAGQRNQKKMKSRLMGLLDTRKSRFVDPDVI